MSEEAKKQLKQAVDDLAGWKNRHPVISNREREATKKIEDIVREFDAKLDEKKP